MREITTRQAREDFANEVNRVAFGGERVLLTRHGRAVAALVPLVDLERLSGNVCANVCAPSEPTPEAA
jgi:prevent-host-death family protein